MKLNRWLVYGPLLAMILIGIVAWLQPSVPNRSIESGITQQEVFGWKTQYATYVRNTANPDYDPEQRVVTIIKIDRDLHKVQYDARTIISNLPEVVAGLPNVAPLATFEGQNLICSLDQELTYPGVGVFVFRCEYPVQ